MDSKPSSHGHEEIVHSPAETKQKRGCLGFVKKWWWAFLIVFLAGFLIVFLVLVYVAFPKIVQGKLDDAVLTIEGIRVTQPQSNSVYTEINSTIRSGGGIQATIEGFNATLYLEDKLPHTPFAYIQMPETSSAELQTVNVSQLLTITDMQAYTDYNTWALLNKTFRMTVSGETYVHVGKFPAYKVNFQKTVNVTGLNGFAGLTVTQPTVTLMADARGDNFKGFASVPNPSTLTVEIGNATFAAMLNNTRIGTLYIDDMQLFPGNNNLSVRASITQGPVIVALTSEPYCHTGILPLQFLGTNVTNHGQALTYYEAGFRQNLQTVPLDVASALVSALGTRLGCTTASNTTTTR